MWSIAVCRSIDRSKMMSSSSRNGRERSSSMLLNHNHRRGHSLNGVGATSNSDDNHLDLFSNNRRSLSLASSDDSSDGTLSFYSILFYPYHYQLSMNECLTNLLLLLLDNHNCHWFLCFWGYYLLIEWSLSYFHIYLFIVVIIIIMIMISFSETGESVTWISKSVQKWNGRSTIIHWRRKAWLRLVSNLLCCYIHSFIHFPWSYIINQSPSSNYLFCYQASYSPGDPSLPIRTRISITCSPSKEKFDQINLYLQGLKGILFSFSLFSIHFYIPSSLLS